MTGHSKLPVLDHSILDQLHEMVDAEAEPRFFEELLGDFFRDAELMIRIIDGKAADRPARQRAAHSLKSTSAMLGALRLSSIADAVEQRYRGKAEWNSSEVDLSGELDQVREALRGE